MDDLDRGDADARLMADTDGDDLIAAATADEDVGLDTTTGDAGPSYTRDAAGRFAATEGGDIAQGFEAGAAGEVDQGDAAGAADAAAEPPKSSVAFREMKEFLDATEGRRAAERERDAARAEIERLTKAAEPQPDPAEDLEMMFRDPAAYHQKLQQGFQEALRAQRFEMQQMFARQQHGDALVEAQKALQATNNEALANSLLQAANPFEALMAWHRREKTLAAIPDGDMTKFETSIQERLLKDPAFLARAAEAARGLAAGAPAARPQGGNLRLPAVSRAGSAASAALPDEPSDQELLDELSAA